MQQVDWRDCLGSETQVGNGRPKSRPKLVVVSAALKDLRMMSVDGDGLVEQLERHFQPCEDVFSNVGRKHRFWLEACRRLLQSDTLNVFYVSTKSTASMATTCWIAPQSARLACGPW